MSKLQTSQTSSTDSKILIESANSLKKEAVQDDLININKNALEDLGRDMIQKTCDYVKNEFDCCLVDYQLLEQFNKNIIEKYGALNPYSRNINNEMCLLNKSYFNLVPLLCQIQNMEKLITGLEIFSNKLEQYAKRLDLKYKQIIERQASK